MISRPPSLAVGRAGEAFNPDIAAVVVRGCCWGGDAVSAARAVLQTGEYDFARNMKVEDELLKR